MPAHAQKRTGLPRAFLTAALALLTLPADDLGETFTRIAQELHSQYLIGFSPQRLDGKVHKLDVRVKPPGLSARARKSYLAAPGSPANGSR